MAAKREYSRQEMLLEASAAIDSLVEVESFGDLRRYQDDKVFRYALAFAWLRLTEPLCRLVNRRLVGVEAREDWSGMCWLRNTLAHDRDEDIDYGELWGDSSETIASVRWHVDRLLIE